MTSTPPSTREASTWPWWLKRCFLRSVIAVITLEIEQKTNLKIKPTRDNRKVIHKTNSTTNTVRSLNNKRRTFEDQRSCTNTVHDTIKWRIVFLFIVWKFISCKTNNTYIVVHNTCIKLLLKKMKNIRKSPIYALICGLIEI